MVHDHEDRSIARVSLAGRDGVPVVISVIRRRTTMRLDDNRLLRVVVFIASRYIHECVSIHIQSVLR